MIDKKAAIEAYKIAERNAHDMVGDPAGYLALTGQCPVAVVERQAHRLGELLRHLDDAEAALAALKGDPNNINWCSPKTVRQLIQQLCTLDPDMETTALLRMPADFRDGKAIRQVPVALVDDRQGSGGFYLTQRGRKLNLQHGTELFTAPQKPVMPIVTDAMAMAFHMAMVDGASPDDDVEDIKDGLAAALRAIEQPKYWTVVSGFQTRLFFSEKDARQQVSKNGGLSIERLAVVGTEWHAGRPTACQHCGQSINNSHICTGIKTAGCIVKSNHSGDGTDKDKK